MRIERSRPLESPRLFWVTRTKRFLEKHGWGTGKAQWFVLGFSGGIFAFLLGFLLVFYGFSIVYRFFFNGFSTLLGLFGVARHPLVFLKA